jgi:hypothetical protein
MVHCVCTRESTEEHFDFRAVTDTHTVSTWPATVGAVDECGVCWYVRHMSSAAFALLKSSEQHFDWAYSSRTHTHTHTHTHTQSRLGQRAITYAKSDPASHIRLHVPLSITGLG